MVLGSGNLEDTVLGPFGQERRLKQDAFYMLGSVPSDPRAIADVDALARQLREQMARGRIQPAVKDRPQGSKYQHVKCTL